MAPQAQQETEHSAAAAAAIASVGSFAADNAVEGHQHRHAFFVRPAASSCAPGDDYSSFSSSLHAIALLGDYYKNDPRSVAVDLAAAVEGLRERCKKREEGDEDEAFEEANYCVDDSDDIDEDDGFSDGLSSVGTYDSECDYDYDYEDGSCDIGDDEDRGNDHQDHHRDCDEDYDEFHLDLFYPSTPSPSTPSKTKREDSCPSPTSVAAVPTRPSGSTVAFVSSDPVTSVVYGRPRTESWEAEDYYYTMDDFARFRREYRDELVAKLQQRRARQRRDQEQEEEEEEKKAEEEVWGEEEGDRRSCDRDCADEEDDATPEPSGVLEAFFRLAAAATGTTTASSIVDATTQRQDCGSKCVSSPCSSTNETLVDTLYLF